jgi:hypothetical protein
MGVISYGKMAAKEKASTMNIKHYRLPKPMLKPQVYR